MSDIRVIVVGHSHIAALKKAGDSLPEDFGLILQFVNLNATRAEQKRSLIDSSPSDGALDRIRKFEPDAVVSCIGGNAHTVFGLLEHPTHFDFAHPGHDRLPIDARRQLVPFSAIQQLLESQMSEHLEELVGLRRAQDKPLIHLESPPVNPSEEHIRRHPGAFQDLMNERGVAPADIRHKLWLLHSAIFRKTCDDNDIHFLSVPADARDERGMLVQEAWNPDPTHANDWYGRRVLDQLKDYVPGVVN